jgi:hypothetical protein
MNNINNVYLTITDYATDGNNSVPATYSSALVDNFVFVKMAGTVTNNGVKKTLGNLSPVEAAVMLGDTSMFTADVPAIYGQTYPSVTLSPTQAAEIQALKIARGDNANLTVEELMQLSKYTSNCTGFSTTSYLKVPIFNSLRYLPQMPEIVPDLARYTSDPTQGTYVQKSYWLYTLNPETFLNPLPVKIYISDTQLKLIGRSVYIQKILH